MRQVPDYLAVPILSQVSEVTFRYCPNTWALSMSGASLTLPLGAINDHTWSFCFFILPQTTEILTIHTATSLSISPLSNLIISSSCAIVTATCFLLLISGTPEEIVMAQTWSSCAAG